MESTVTEEVMLSARPRRELGTRVLLRNFAKKLILLEGERNEMLESVVSQARVVMECALHFETRENASLDKTVSTSTRVDHHPRK